MNASLCVRVCFCAVACACLHECLHIVESDSVCFVNTERDRIKLSLLWRSLTLY